MHEPRGDIRADAAPGCSEQTPRGRRPRLGGSPSERHVGGRLAHPSNRDRAAGAESTVYAVVNRRLKSGALDTIPVTT